MLAALARGSQAIAAQVLSLGQNLFESLPVIGAHALSDVFLLRDGAHLSRRVRQAIIRWRPNHKTRLIGKFATVVKATVRAASWSRWSRGLLGGLAFMVLDLRAPLLWGALMALLSLLPAGEPGWSGCRRCWLAADGRIGAGGGAGGLGVLVIGLADNLLRPLLVGKDTRLPDYLALISTLGGLSLFGVRHRAGASHRGAVHRGLGSSGGRHRRAGRRFGCGPAGCAGHRRTFRHPRPCQQITW